MTDFPDWIAPHPVIPADNVLFSQAGLNLPAATNTALISTQEIDGTSYQILTNILTPAGPTVPLPMLVLQWSDVNHDVVDIHHWVLLATNVTPAANNTQVTLFGPTRGKFLTVITKNFDPALTMTQQLILTGSSRTPGKQNGNSISNNISGTFTFAGNTWSTPDSSPTNLMLGESPSIAIPAGTTQFRINALYAGAGQLNVSAPAGSSVAAALYFVNPELATPYVQFYRNVVDANGNLNSNNIPLPRGVTVIGLTNNGTASVNVGYSLEALEVAT